MFKFYLGFWQDVLIVQQSVSEWTCDPTARFYDVKSKLSQGDLFLYPYDFAYNVGKCVDTRFEGKRKRKIIILSLSNSDTIRGNRMDLKPRLCPKCVSCNTNTWALAQVCQSFHRNFFRIINHVEGISQTYDNITYRLKNYTC